MIYDNLAKPNFNFSDLWDELNGGGELVGTLYGIPIIVNRFVPDGVVLVRKGPVKWKFVRSSNLDKT